MDAGTTGDEHAPPAGYAPTMTHLTERLRARLTAAPARARGDDVAAAVALVLVPGAGGLELLLIERAQREGDPWSGHMALPGGRFETEDGDALATARRETFEETGVALFAEHLLAGLDDVFPLNRAAGMLVRPYAFLLGERPAIVASDEVANALWVPLNELDSCACTAEVEIRGSKLSVDAFRCGPHVVWGMTHRIVSDLLDRLADLR